MIFSRIRCAFSACKSIIIINFACWLVAYILNIVGITGWQKWLILSVNPQSTLLHPWTLLTYAWIHFSFWHLLVNMMWLWIFAPILESYIGSRKLWLLYIGGSFFGAIIYSIASLLFPSTGLVLTGASAAVIAVAVRTAFCAPNIEIKLMFLGSIRLKWIVIIAVGIILIGNTSATWAHIGGVIGGIMPWLYEKLNFSYFINFLSLKSFKKKIQIRNTAKAMQRWKKDNARLDDLIDKIKKSGHTSLSTTEQRELTILTRRLKNNS